MPLPKSLPASTKLIVASILALVSWPLAGAPPSHAPGAVNVPGTGVYVVMPPGFSAGPLGAYFVDAADKTIVAFILGPKDHEPPAGARYRISNPQPFQNPYASGTIDEGLGPDELPSFTIRITGKKLALFVIVTDKSHDPARLQQLKDALASLSWDERQADAERAFGAHLSVRGLALYPLDYIGGGLAYSIAGQPNSYRKLVVLLMPMAAVPAARRSALLAKLCDQRIRSTPPTDPNLLNKNGILGCDVWHPDSDARLTYRMLMAMPNGAVLLAGGAGGTPEEFRAALLGMTVTRRQSGRVTVRHRQDTSTPPPDAGDLPP